MLSNGLIPHLFSSTDNYPVWFWIGVVGIVIIAYLLGSINSAILVSKILYRDDIRKYGSGNAGLTNMHRTFGLKAAGFTLLGDMLKTVISVLVPMFLFGFVYDTGLCANQLSYVAGVMAVLGHVFPIYYGFKGGKGVLVTSTMALVVSPAIFGVLLLVFIGVVAMSKYISLGSVMVAALYPVCLNFYFTTFILAVIPPVIIGVAIFLAIFILWLHRENLKRIGNRTERKFSFKKKPDRKKENSGDAE